MVTLKHAFRMTLAAFAFCGLGSANAALVNFTLTGEVDLWADTPNDFGLVMNDSVTVSGTFDDSVLSGGSGTVSFGFGSGNTMTLTVGSMIFDETDDDQYVTGFPQLDLLSGGFDSLNYGTSFGSFGSFDSLDNFFDGYDDSDNLISGTWDANSFVMTPVPVPAAIWLFGSGLIGLAGIVRRKHSA